MSAIIPWQDLAKVGKPFYPKPAWAGRRPIGIDQVLLIYCLQHWFQLSDPGAEEVL